MTNPRTLRRLHTELRDLARELTQPVERTIMRDPAAASVQLVPEQTSTKAVVPSLIDQLRAATATSSGRGKGLGGTPLPIDPDATEMLLQITSDARMVHITAYAATHNIEPEHAARYVEYSTVEDDITAIATLATRWADDHRVEEALTYLRTWRDEITGHLDPQQHLHLNAPCPACGVKMLRRWDPKARETVQVHTLQYDAARECMRCVNPACGHEWPTTNLHHLAQVLGCEPVGEDDDRGRP